MFLQQTSDMFRKTKQLILNCCSTIFKFIDFRNFPAQKTLHLNANLTPFIMTSKNINKVIPALLDAVDKNIVDNERASHYPAVTELKKNLEERFTALAPTNEELTLSADLEQKQALESKIEEFFDRYAEPIHKVMEGGDTPEYLLPRRKKTAEFYSEAFAGIDGWSDEIKAEINAKTSAEMSLEAMQTNYAEWKKIYDAQQSKSDLLERLAEIVDIKQTTIGILRLLNLSPREIYQTIWSAEDED
jgi:hypothetical protein